MKDLGPIASTMDYGKKLVEAGVTGVRSGQQRAFEGSTLADYVGDSARHSLALAAAGACLGLVQGLVISREKRVSRTIALAAVGGVVGFLAGFSWKTRTATRELAHSARVEIGKARDQHWLESNPINYA